MSVLMAVHNEERHIRQAVESILGQTFTDFEFLVLDDGSSDRTREILQSYAGDPRLHLLTQANAGLTRSLNRCLSLACGRYIARMDGNDVSLPHRLEAQADFLDRHPGVGLLGAYYINIDEKGASLKLYRYPTEDA
ncbi:MAG TPA: glycosyltransferase family A protein, partial [Candidatus Sulfotelmatobacter sp.]|nr:glycosyltransferase family A protein [Candidatus Sulfotelmatobacter sp.]